MLEAARRHTAERGDPYKVEVKYTQDEKDAMEEEIAEMERLTAVTLSFTSVVTGYRVSAPYSTTRHTTPRRTIPTPHHAHTVPIVNCRKVRMVSTSSPHFRSWRMDVATAKYASLSPEGAGSGDGGTGVCRDFMMCIHVLVRREKRSFKICCQISRD